MRGVNIMLNQLWVSKTARFGRCLFCGLIAFLFVNGLAWGADDANKLINVSVDSGAATPTVLIETAEPVGYRYTVYDSFEPTRVVIDFFMYYMKGDMRNKLMNEFPMIYNKLCEREIMGTVNLTREVQNEQEEILS